MKTSLRKLVAMICVLAIAAVLPVMASAEGTTKLALTAPEYAKAGETIVVSLDVEGNEGWDLLDAVITYDEGLTPVKSLNEWDEELDCIKGAAMADAMPSVNLEAEEGVLIGVISANVVKRNGNLLTIAFQVAEGVEDGTEMNLTMTVNAFSESIVVEGTPAGKNERVEAGTVLAATVIAGEKPVVTTTTTKDDVTTTTKDDVTTTTKDDVTTTTEDDVTTTTEDDVTTTTAADSDVPPTGETATLFVLALVLMAGSAVALISMKKKALSK